MEQESVNSQESKKEEEPKPFIGWDTCQIAQHHADFLREEDPKLSESDAFTRAQGDCDLFEHEWEYISEYLTEKMEEVGEGYWGVSIDDFGWRNQSLKGVFEAKDGKTFLQKVLPDCECTFDIYERDHEDGKMFYIHNFHHDSPMGESYYVYPISAAKFHGEEEEEGEEE